MKHKLSTAVGFMLFTLIPFVTSAVHAQTVAPGPYYAMPAWDQTLTCTTPANCPRFIVLSNMNNAAVLDRETGLVWERSPSTTPTLFSSGQASLHCISLRLGNRTGWRLPSVQELLSLVDADPANTASPRLPPGHPFQNLQFQDLDGIYWSSTLLANPQFAWAVFLGNGLAGGDFVGASHFVWCVHGGKGQDAQ